jgi:hypothetical protein
VQLCPLGRQKSPHLRSLTGYKLLPLNDSLFYTCLIQPEEHYTFRQASAAYEVVENSGKKHTVKS